MSALTEAEARARAALIDVDSYDVFLDLTADPVRSRTEIRFGCREPGAGTFAELTTAAVLGAALNGRMVGPPEAGRLGLPGLAAQNVLVVDAEVACSRGSGDGLTRFTDPADGAGYLLYMGYPTESSSVFCCFDQPDLTATVTLSLVLPAGWDCATNGPVAEWPPAGQAGMWRFGPVQGMRPYDLTIAAGPYVEVWRGTGGAGGAVSMSVRRRPSLDGAPGVTDIGRFAEMARQTLEYYERTLLTPCPYLKYDIAFVPDLNAMAISIPGLMLVNETVLARLPDPDDDRVEMVCAHEVAHLWFGCHVSMSWWDDVWQDEAMATYMSYTAMADLGTSADPWAGFCYREKPRAYRADELPGRQPVSSPVDSAADALFRLPALTYFKGAAVIRQLAALIGDDALRAGLADYMTRFAGRSASLDDLIACWSRACGRDLAGWADEWLRTEGASTLRASVTAGPDGTIESLAVLQDAPRTHRIGIGLYDLSGGRLVRRRVVSAEVSGARAVVPSVAGLAVPDALVLNEGDLSYARIGFDERTLHALAQVAMDVGDPLTEAVCWNAAWERVTGGSLAAADLGELIARRLGRTGLGGTGLGGTGLGGTLPAAGLEVLIERAVSCADVYAPPAERAGLRSRIARACLDAAGRATAGSGRQRALAAGFAASGQTDGQLELMRSWLTGTSRPDGLEIDGELRGRMLRTLSSRGLASDDDLDAMVAADPVTGERHRATCCAVRPDGASKEAAWVAALADGPDWRLALAHANGVWVPGQEALMAGYLDRYFGEALPALDGREVGVMRSLARALYPATLTGPSTLAATEAAVGRDGLSHGLRLVVLEQEAILRSVITARLAARRWLLLEGG
jgi:aminopeptidase N